MKRLILFIIISSLVLYSCKKEDQVINIDSPLIGIWNYSFTQDNLTVYTHNTKFIENYGYKFNSDGTLVERKNSGWCATPPVSYADFDGTWSMINDTVVEIKAAYWGGTTTSRLDIEYLSSYTFKFITISSESKPF
jgi:hypothetical protein